MTEPADQDNSASAPSSRKSLRGAGRGLALAWLLVVAVLLGHNAYLWLVQRASPDTDILALLPSSRHDDVMQQAFAHMVDSAQQKVVVLIGEPDWNKAMQAASAYEAVIGKQAALLQPLSADAAQLQGAWLASFDQSRLMLLTQDQRDKLRNDSPQQWSQLALSTMYGAFGGPRLGAWQDDPFGLFGGWVQERAQETPVRPRDGRLFVDSGGRSYVLLLLNLQQSAFSISAQQQIIPLLDQAGRAAKQAVPDAEIITAGVILHAAAGSQQAGSEMTTIGAGSLIGIVLLMWLTFRSLRPIALIALSIAIGCLGALSVSWLLFGRLHLLTLVFGASLVGIAQDYAIYFLCARLGTAAQIDSRELLRRLLPGLALMLLAAIIGYLGMALTPFPGLRQMAVFSVLGLLFAWLTVILWFPALIHADTLRSTAPADRYSHSINRWPRFSANRNSYLLLAVFAVFTAAGLARLNVSDDIRALQKTPQHLIDDQIKLGKLLDTPTPAQFYLVRGDTAEQVLQREEQLKQRLQDLIAKKMISGVQAVSNWVPSQRQQQSDRDLIASALLTPQGPLAAIAAAVDETEQWQQDLRQRLLAHSKPLLPQAFIDSPAGQPWRHLWLGKTGAQYASIVAVRGLNDYRRLPLLAAAAAPGEGVQWVDKVADISAVLRYYREYMTWALLAAYFTIFLLLTLRYRRAAWRAIAPPLVATLATLALFGLTGQPLQLFHVLACLLLLGLGVDYGIFLQEPTDRHQRFSWLTVGLSAISALLSFGLLALSNSPPLHAFGLTMLIGMALVWLISPCFRGAASSSLSPHETKQ
ncbi:MMPL family transporter [Herbaspirillum hiltneri]|uniref:MMPL family transporter n=1 Tax=Herbaspirillum hiltneri TaxID=341045 RepID=UPI000AC52560|nr:MMPL family transporter [Herbaspirillum hiltneri]